MKSDKEIWQEGLADKEGAERFNTNPGGKYAKPLKNRPVGKSPTEKRIDARIIKLEKQVDKIITEILKLKLVSSKQNTINRNTINRNTKK